jgi:hypothetical protein
MPDTTDKGAADIAAPSAAPVLLLNCFLTSVGAQTYVPTFNTEDEIKGYDGWHDWAVRHGHQTTYPLGKYPAQEGETPQEAFKRIKREQGWPDEGARDEFWPDE